MLLTSTTADQNQAGVQKVKTSNVINVFTTAYKDRADRKKLEAMEMWIRRRMEKISWVDTINNEEVLQSK